MSPITTHVLDTALGKPAAGITVTLCQVAEDGVYVEVGRGVTNADGRVADLLPDEAAVQGTYRIEFATASYFAATERGSFYPRVEVLFSVEQEGGHYHVPLLLSPFGFSTYRGS
ncbi:MAG: hydroxyisourate hydrolase [Planctomycetota bacterium]